MKTTQAQLAHRRKIHAAAIAKAGLVAPKPRSQKERLIGHLRAGWVTPLDALGLVNCLSLSQRCGELRRDGALVIDKWVKTPTGKRVKAYHIPRATRG